MTMTSFTHRGADAADVALSAGRLFSPASLAGTPRSATGRAARAYCGPAHGSTWSLDPTRTAPEDVILRHGAGDFSYRLVHDQRLRRPAQDGEGRLIYLPSYKDVLAISALLIGLSIWF